MNNKKPEMEKHIEEYKKEIYDLGKFLGIILKIVVIAWCLQVVICIALYFFYQIRDFYFVEEYEPTYSLAPDIESTSIYDSSEFISQWFTGYLPDKIRSTEYTKFDGVLFDLDISAEWRMYYGYETWSNFESYFLEPEGADVIAHIDTIMTAYFGEPIVNSKDTKTWESEDERVRLFIVTKDEEKYLRNVSIYNLRPEVYINPYFN